VALLSLVVLLSLAPVVSAEPVAAAAGLAYDAQTRGPAPIPNPHGIPIGQVLLPGRDEVHNLNSTSMALRPGTKELYIVTHDGLGEQGAAIFQTQAFAPGLPLYALSSTPWREPAVIPAP
jgi:hypothetical protein